MNNQGIHLESEIPFLEFSKAPHIFHLAVHKFIISATVFIVMGDSCSELFSSANSLDLATRKLFCALHFFLTKFSSYFCTCVSASSGSAQRAACVDIRRRHVPRRRLHQRRDQLNVERKVRAWRHHPEPLLRRHRKIHRQVAACGRRVEGARAPTQVSSREFLMMQNCQ